jgi:hypothetical protein
MQSATPYYPDGVRILACACVAAALAAIAAAPVRAHGDPITDSLLTTSIFFPPEVNVSDLLVRELTDEVQRAEAAGKPVKVAIVNAPSDLGPRAGFFNKPQPFAVFVARDLSAFHSGAVIVAMANGIGFVPAAGSSQDRTLLTSVPIGAGPNGLTQAATEAVRRVTGASDQPTSVGGDGGSGWGDRIAIGGAILAAILLVVGIQVARKRRRASVPST